MILPEVNRLIYAHNTHAAQNATAVRRWNERLQGNDGVALAWVVVLGFVRIATAPQGLDQSNPMTVSDALNRVEEWLSRPHVRLIHPAETHFGRWAALFKQIATAADLTTDAHLAALAIERGFLHTTDADFARVPGLKWRNPLKET
jgi:toxin-antitoxin system PIN domain toxin